MREKSNKTVILVVGQSVEEYDFVKNWLASKEYSMRETADIYDVLDEISDFTLRHRPDVFMLQTGSESDDIQEIHELINTFSACSDFLVASVNGAENFAVDDSPAQMLTKTEAALNTLLPALSRAATVQ